MQKEQHGLCLVPVKSIITASAKMKCDAYQKINHTITLLTQCAQQNDNFSSQKNDQLLQNLVTDLLHFAEIKMGSDIHLEPQENTIRIRLRIDGVLAEYFHLPIYFSSQLCCKLKILANMDISQSRLPQDSKFIFNFKNGLKIHVRMNTCPTIRGEKIVLRLLKNNMNALGLETLGMLPQQLKDFKHAFTEPHGLILITGPTGSGKTSTLYSALTHMNTQEKNIITIEDPVEVYLTGVNQININTKAELNFSTVLRSILRQDPDVIMIGEIRDEETAKIAIKAANTGHLVLSTLHTNNCIETINRLRQMNIDQNDLISCLRLIVSQRLLRKKSTQGYSGRQGIFEFLLFNEAVRKLLFNKSFFTESDLRAVSPFISLAQQAHTWVSQGITTQEEILRVMNLC